MLRLSLLVLVWSRVRSFPRAAEKEAEKRLEAAFARIRNEAAPKELKQFPRPFFELESSQLFTISDQLTSGEFSSPVVSDASRSSPHGGVFFTIRTDSKFYETRLAWVLETWAKDVPEQALNVIGDVATNGTIEGLPKTVVTATRCPPHSHGKGACCKTAEAVISAHEALKKDTSLKWAHFADDDVYLVPSAMEQALKEESDASPGKAVALGKFGCATLHCKHSLCGGGGYAFSREAVALMVGDDPASFLEEVMNDCEKCNNWDDIAISQVLQERGIELRQLKGIHPWKLNSREFCESTEVGIRNLVFHYIDSRHQMEMLHDMFSGKGGNMLIKHHTGPCVVYNGRRPCAASWKQDDLPFKVFKANASAACFL